MYEILYHPRSIKFLKKLPKKEAEKIHQKIKILQKDPFSQALDIKRLVTTERSWRMRVGNLRIIFELDSQKKTIYINEIDFRGNVY